ncbi:MAG: hypothetical protein QXN55_01570 [Candidatus Nitrosotenuis sp.]
MAKQAKAEPRDLTSIINNPSDRIKLQNFVDEASNCMTRIADERLSIKDIRDEAIEKLGIDPKLFNFLVKTTFDNSSSEKKAEIEAFEVALNAFFNME